MYIVHMYIYIYIYIYICIYTWDIIIDDPFKHDILDMDINGNCVVHLLFLTLFFWWWNSKASQKKNKYIMHVNISLSISICIKYSENMDASSDSN